MSNDWTYHGAAITDADIKKEYLGFIYLITQLSTGKRYIGRKLLTKAASKQINGKKKKIRKDSDWKEYWSSSPTIKNWISAAGGTDDFTREILVFCTSKGSMVYLEELALYSLGALESDNWINENIRSKVYKTWVKQDEAVLLRDIISKFG